MNNRHRKTLAAIFATPISGTILWADIEALLVVVGAVLSEGKGFRIRFEHQGETVYFHRPHPGKEALRYRVADAREFLRRIGVNDENNGL